MYFLTNENPYGRSLSLRRHTYYVNEISYALVSLAMDTYNTLHDTADMLILKYYIIC